MGGDPDRLHRLVVCTSCRSPGETREPLSQRAGARLYEALQHDYSKWARRELFAISPHECFGACTRACTVALAAAAKYTYVFGDLRPRASESALIECASLHGRTANGFLPRDKRPVALQSNVLARIPPFEVE